MLVEFDGEVYKGDNEKGEYSSRDVACVELYHELHHVGYVRGLGVGSRMSLLEFRVP